MADNKVDLDSLDASTLAETVEINPDINPLAAPAPADDGKYRVKLLAADSGWTSKTTNNATKTPFLMTKFSAQILAEGTKNNNKRAFSQVNTLVFDGKSEMAYILRMVYGDTPEARAAVSKLNNYISLAQAFKQALAAEPTIQIKGRWEAQRVETDKDGNKTYSTVRTGQRNFPPILDGDGKPTGEFNHVLFDEKTQSEVSAQFVIKDYFPDNV